MGAHTCPQIICNVVCDSGFASSMNGVVLSTRKCLLKDRSCLTMVEKGNSGTAMRAKQQISFFHLLRKLFPGEHCVCDQGLRSAHKLRLSHFNNPAFYVLNWPMKHDYEVKRSVNKIHLLHLRVYNQPFRQDIIGELLLLPRLNLHKHVGETGLRNHKYLLSFVAFILFVRALDAALVHTVSSFH
jgi:hypothetical protein